MKNTSRIKRLQQHIDELIVQLDLGKLEAVDYLEEHKERLKSLAKRIGQSITAGPAKRHLDELQLQLSLGKMETADAYADQRKKIAEAVANLRESLKEAEVHTKDELHDTASALNDKVHLLALNLGAAGILAVEGVGNLKTKLRTKLAELAGSVQAEAELTEEKAREVAEQSGDALKDIRDNLRGLWS